MAAASAGAPPRARRTGAVVALLAAIGSVVGLLSTPIEAFDDGALLMGARLVRAGRLPYRDFYTLYGPFGYTLQGWIGKAFGNPALALRVGQAALFLAVVALAAALDRRTGGGRVHPWALLLFVLGLSACAPLASFYALGLAVASLLCLAFAQGAAADAPAAARWATAAGVLIGAVALTRPPFALYAGVAGILMVSLAGSGRALRLLAIAAGACAGILLFLWLALYAAIPWEDLVENAVFAAARLAAGGGRYYEGPLMRASYAATFLWGASILAAMLPWALAATGRAAGALVGIAVLVGGLEPLWLRGSSAPARDAALLAGADVALVAALAARSRRALAEPRRWAAALLGVAGAAFTHYFWSRQDLAHAVVLLALASASAALALNGLGAARRGLALAALLLLAAPVGVHNYPLAALWDGRAARLLHTARAPGGAASVWPCTEVPADAARAVALADRLASAGSRFVAVGSSQAVAAIDPVILFLLSARPPYTRWYTYDPGVQDTPAVQDRMRRELAESGSETAVVWQVPGAERSAFDAAFEELYPTTVARFGDYEIRRR